jgi:eukaryotic-like serine/threonine-protein kinase
LALAPGSRLGVYEVTAPIGEGGMEQVYRARDTKLNRDVALKVLPDSFANDPERLARFTREAQTLASLNHQNIAHIHGLEESGGVRALVMELVEGEDLSQRIGRGALPVDEALPIAMQIADALEAAHEQNIIHRDLNLHGKQPRIGVPTPLFEVRVGRYMIARTPCRATVAFL